MKRVLALAGALMVAGSASAAVINWQLNMNVQIGLGNFVPGVDQVVVRGYFNGWGGTNPTLTDPDNDGIYTGSFDQGAFAGPYEYKYVIIHGWGDEWEWVSNRPYTYTEPTIDLPLEYFNNVTTLPGVCDVEPTFSVDMGVQIATGAFNPGAGDLIVIRGPFNGWGGTTHPLSNVGGTIYEGTFPFAAQAETSPIEYKFVIVSGGDNWESSPNRLSYADCDWVDTDNDGYKEGSFPTVFFANVGWDAIIDHPVTVNFHIDASRVSCFFANGGAPVYDGIAAYSDVDFISVHGFFNNWPGWDGNINAMYRAINLGSCQWLVSVTFPTGSAKNQIYKFGLNGFDNEAGFGQDHSVDLGAAGVESFFDVFVEFGSNGTQWDCFSGCVETVDARETPSSFALAQNVPNPFNPATTLSFTLDQTANASLKVYDLSGAQVATLVNGVLEAGTHEVVFDGSKLASGVYVYTLQSEGAVESRKMVLVK
jgi:hypothetical protein